MTVYHIGTYYSIPRSIASSYPEAFSVLREFGTLDVRTYETEGSRTWSQQCVTLWYGGLLFWATWISRLFTADEAWFVIPSKTALCRYTKGPDA